MERFVQVVLAGGVALLAGLWTVRLTGAWSPAWLAGVALATIGVAGLAVGIGRELDVPD